MNDQIQQKINRSSLKYEQQQKILWVTGLLMGLTFFVYVAWVIALFSGFMVIL